MIAIAASVNQEKLCKEIYGDEVIYIPWQRPGFDIGLKIEQLIKDNPQAKGVLLGHHGMSSWDNDDKTCYETALEIIDRAASYIEAHDKGEKTFGGPKYKPIDESVRQKLHCRDHSVGSRTGFGPSRRFVGTVQDDGKMLRFVNSVDGPRLAELGTSCPDHFLRTKIKPLFVDWNPANGDIETLKAAISSGSGAISQGLRSLLRSLQTPGFAGDARPEPDRRSDSRARHDRLGQEQERIARDGGVLQLRDRGDAWSRSHRRVRSDGSAGGVRHRVLAA